VSEVDLLFEKQAIALLQQDPDKAFNLIYDKFNRDLLKFALHKVGDKRIAEDLLQNVFSDFWSNKDKVNRSIYGYLFNAMKYQIFNFFRSEKVKNKYIIHLSHYLEEINKVTPQKYLEAKDLMQHIESLVGQLPKQCRLVFVLSRFENKSNDEIAESLQISKRTVENYITQALAFIRKKNESVYLALTFSF